ncbi:MAG: LysM peptidoglycan-binding domain-containing protein [Verrucomicrobiota bacterium]
MKTAFHSHNTLLFAAACTAAAVLCSCQGRNKNQQAATEPAAAAPSAAYPDSPALAQVDDSVSTAPAPSSSYSAPPAPSKPSIPKITKPSFTLNAGEELISYKVQSGDTLSAIASKYNTTVTRIQAANGLKSTKILAGKTYKIPTKTASSAPSTSALSNDNSRSYSPPKVTTTIPTKSIQAPAFKTTAPTLTAPSYGSTNTPAIPKPSFEKMTPAVPSAPAPPKVTAPTQSSPAVIPGPPTSGSTSFPTPTFSTY